MNKVYLLFPVVALAAFTTYWYGFKTNYERQADEKKAQEQRLIDEKVASDRKAREDAIKAAVESNAQRKAAKAAKEAKEAKEKSDREAAIESRNKAKSEQFKLQAQEERTAKELAEVQAEVKKIEEALRVQTSERDFLKVYVTKAEENAKSLQAVAAKVEKTDESIRKAAKELTSLKAKSS